MLYRGLEFWLVGFMIVTCGCSRDNKHSSEVESTPTKVENTVDVRTGAIPVPVSTRGVEAENSASTEPKSLGSMRATTPGASNPNADIGYEGLVQRINELQNTVLPVLLDKNQRFSAESGKQAVTLSNAYMKSVQHATSVEKELRHELWDLAVDLNAGFMELVQASPGERYDALREILLNNIESIQRLLRDNAQSE